MNVFDDLSSLVVDEVELVKTASAPDSVAVRKPARDEWFRVSTEPQHEPMVFCIYEPSGSRQAYLVIPSVAKNETMQQVSKKKIIYVATNRRGEVFLSMVGTGDDSYSVSSRAAHKQAQQKWTKQVANQIEKRYDTSAASFDDTSVTFPGTPYNELLKQAFAERVIDSLSHPLALEVRGLSRPDE
jgi:hypothetical protein